RPWGLPGPIKGYAFPDQARTYFQNAAFLADLEAAYVHLHPLAQANLADVIIYAARRRRVQVIVESHSEHLLLRLQRRIAEGTLPANDVKLYFCDAPAGVSQLTELDLDPFGNIGNWPPNFMGDAFGETAGAERARLERQRAKAAE